MHRFSFSIVNFISLAISLPCFLPIQTFPVVDGRVVSLFLFPYQIFELLQYPSKQPRVLKVSAFLTFKENIFR